MKRFFAACLFAASVVSVFHTAAKADEFFSETIPLEISLLYNRFTDTIPDFYALAKQSPVYINSPELGKDIVLENQKRSIEILFYAMSKTTPITVIDNLSVIVNKGDESDFLIKEAQEEDLNYIYDMDGRSYVVFVRNTSVIKYLPGLKSSEKLALYSLINRDIKAGVELTLKPVTADIRPFDYKGEKMNLILADIAAIRFIDNTSGEIIKEYQPIKDPPKPSKMDAFFREVIKQRRSVWSKKDSFKKTSEE